MLIPERLWQQMTPDEQAKVEEAVEGIRTALSGTCPGCGMRLVSKVKLTGHFIAEDKEERTPPTPPMTHGDRYIAGRDANQRAIDDKFLAEAKDSGMLAAFAEAVSHLKPQQQPNDMGQFLLVFFRTYGEKMVPRDVLAKYSAEFSGRLDFWSGQGIVAVLADRVVRAFVPSHFIFGATVRDAKGKARASLGTDVQALDTWVRGRHGYVPLGAPNFTEAMNRKSRGEFQDVR